MGGWFEQCFESSNASEHVVDLLVVLLSRGGGCGGMDVSIAVESRLDGLIQSSSAE